MSTSPERVVAASLAEDGLPSEQVSLDLLERARSGDASALERLLTRYQSRLQRIVRIQLGSSPLRRWHDSMDFVQNTFLAALPKLGEFHARSAAGVLRWLATIATHQICDAYDHQHAAKRDVRRIVPLDQAGEGAAGGVQDPDSAVDPHRLAVKAETRDLLDAAVAALPEEQRAVVLLRDYCGESWEVISGQLDRSSGASRQLHQRAWIKLRAALRPILESSTQDRPEPEQP